MLFPAPVIIHLAVKLPHRNFGMRSFQTINNTGPGHHCLLVGSDNGILSTSLFGKGGCPSVVAVVCDAGFGAGIGKNQKFQNFTVRLFLPNAPLEYIDYNWESRMLYLFMKYLELEHLIWNLSTLGGACSAMADYDLAFAKRASEISEKQMQIAAELDDRVLLARCHLYIALSAAQQADFAVARRIVRTIYSWSIRTRNEFIQACCRGVRAKVRSIELYGTKALQYECRRT